MLSKKVVFPGLALLIPAACCPRQTQTPQPVPAPAHQPVATAPLAQVINPLTRPSIWRECLLSVQQEYIVNEGPNRRGKDFARLLGAIEEVRSKDGPVTELEVLTLLGRPDYGRSEERGAEYFYLYGERAPKDAYVVLDFDKTGKLTLMGYNVVTQIDLTKLPPYKAWPKIP